MSKQAPTVVGKRGEQKFITALMERGFSVFVPVVDVGIDVIAEAPFTKQPPRYFAFQVKTSTLSKKSNSWYWYVDVEGFRYSKMVYYIFVFDDTQNIPPTTKNRDSNFNALIISSPDLQREFRKQGRWRNGHEGNISITPSSLANGRTKWMKYLNQWASIK